MWRDTPFGTDASTLQQVKGASLPFTKLYEIIIRVGTAHPARLKIYFYFVLDYGSSTNYIACSIKLLKEDL